MVFFVVLTVLKVSTVVYFTKVWRNMKLQQAAVAALRFSVIVPVRNEAHHISQLLEDLEEQTYDKALFEVLVVDDSSEDETCRMVTEFSRKVRYKLTLIHLRRENKQGKKAALTTAIRQADGDYILTTDGDCRLPEAWISSFAAEYQSGEVMICGPVRIMNDDFFSALQAMEFSSLIGFGAVSLETGHPATCNGANLSYRKDVFHEVGGYEGNDLIPTGDDEFLLVKVWNKYPRRVRFLKNQFAMVSTPAKKSLSGLLSQRKRWTSKWKFHKNWYIKGSAILFFTDNTLQILAVCMAIVGYWPASWVLVCLVIRWVTEFLFLNETTGFCRVSMKPSHFLLNQIIYPFFVVFLGLASIFGKYSWKGRKY